MTLLIPLMCILSLALAEPPVGDGYPSARSSYDHSYDQGHDHGNVFQRSLSQEYGPPAARSLRAPRNSLSTEYVPPSARTANPRSGLSQTYVPPNARSGISQEYGVTSARSPAKYSPASKSLSTEYGLPSARSGPSQTYGDTTRSSQFSESALSRKYGVPSPRSGNFQQSHGAAQSFSKSFTSSSPRSFKGSSQFGARPLSTSYGAPAARSSSSYAQDSLSQTYEAPSQRDLSDTYGLPSVRGLSQEYGVPASRTANQKTSAIASSYSAASRSVLSDTYGTPSGRVSMPSEQYGVPDQYSSLSNEGYSYARDALDETLEQDPANYDFTYKVNDYESGSDFGHTETRQDNRAEGSYFVLLPDGTKQVVEYKADERGFKPRIFVDPADLGRSGGYDDNAAELASSNDETY